MKAVSDQPRMLGPGKLRNSSSHIIKTSAASHLLVHRRRLLWIRGPSANHPQGVGVAVEKDTTVFSGAPNDLPVGIVKHPVRGNPANEVLTVWHEAKDGSVVVNLTDYLLPIENLVVFR